MSAKRACRPPSVKHVCPHQHETVRDHTRLETTHMDQDCAALLSAARFVGCMFSFLRPRRDAAPPATIFWIRFKARRAGSFRAPREPGREAPFQLCGGGVGGRCGVSSAAKAGGQLVHAVAFLFLRRRFASDLICASDNPLASCRRRVGFFWACRWLMPSVHRPSTLVAACCTRQ